MIYYTSLDTMYGKLGLIRNEKGLIKIYLPNKPISIEMLNKDYPNQEIVENNSRFINVIKQLNEYFDGNRKDFELDIELNISSFNKKVLIEVSKVPYGKTASYSDIALRVQNSKAVRAIGSANARNPIPIIIPCHRIVAKNGKLGGYRGGLPMKEKLLKFENNNLNSD